MIIDRSQKATETSPTTRSATSNFLIWGSSDAWNLKHSLTAEGSSYVSVSAHIWRSSLTLGAYLFVLDTFHVHWSPA